MNKKSLIIATRKSPLALWQAHWVKAQLEHYHPLLTVDILGVTTTADRFANVPLQTIGNKDLFVKELELALLQGRADIAVHSMKDVPMDLPPGLHLPVICIRDDPRDALISNQFSSLAELPAGARIATASLRRQSQLYAINRALQCLPVRGNVGTRLNLLDENKYDALVLAVAGLKRLNFENRITAILPTDICLPAAGQGALGIECCLDDTAVQALISPLNHLDTAACVTAERALCRKLAAGCNVPIGSYAEMTANGLMLKGLIASPDGRLVLRATLQDSQLTPDDLGHHVADHLLQQGADDILQKLGTADDGS